MSMSSDVGTLLSGFKIKRDCLAEQETLATLHYLAGLFDGEGHAGIHKGMNRGSGKYKNRYKFPYLSPRMQVRMCDELPVREFLILGGSVHKSGVTKTGKKMYQWCTASRKAQTAAMILLPFIKNPAKRVQLEKVLRFYDSSAT